MLKNEYLKNQNWSREFINRFSQKLGLSWWQVYKWHWDQGKVGEKACPRSKNTK
jgi:hypothetical protein